MQVALALGANLDQRRSTLEHATQQLITQVGKLIKQSKCYETAAVLHPQNPDPQPDYLNAVILLDTDLAPQEILAVTQSIEESFGRKHQSLPWAARKIDIDIIAMEDLVLKSPQLQIPHPHMHVRLFVLEPMAEIAPDWKHPVLGLTVLEMLQVLKTQRA